MDRSIAKIIGDIKASMDAHAHEAMNLNSDVIRHAQIVGAYRGMQHCLDLIEAALHSDEEAERNS